MAGARQIALFQFFIEHRYIAYVVSALNESTSTTGNSKAFRLMNGQERDVAAWCIFCLVLVLVDTTFFEEAQESVEQLRSLRTR